MLAFTVAIGAVCYAAALSLLFRRHVLALVRAVVRLRGEAPAADPAPALRS